MNNIYSINKYLPDYMENSWRCMDAIVQSLNVHSRTMRKCICVKYPFMYMYYQKDFQTCGGGKTWTSLWSYWMLWDVLYTSTGIFNIILYFVYVWVNVSSLTRHCLSIVILFILHFDIIVITRVYLFFFILYCYKFLCIYCANNQFEKFQISIESAMHSSSIYLLLLAFFFLFFIQFAIFKHNSICATYTKLKYFTASIKRN